MSAIIDTSLLTRENLNIGKFIYNLTSEVNYEAKELSVVAPNSINAKVNTWRELVIGNANEQQCRITYATGGWQFTYVTYGLIKYLQDNWELKLDLLSYYRGAIPTCVEVNKQIYSSVAEPQRGIRHPFENAGHIRQVAPTDLEFWTGVVTGKSLAPSFEWRGLLRQVDGPGFEKINQTTRSLFRNPHVYVEVDKTDHSPAAMVCRASMASMTRRRDPYLYSKALEEMQAMSFNESKEVFTKAVWLQSLMDSVYFGEALFVLAPKESFITTDTLSDRMLEADIAHREFMTGEWHFRRKRELEKARSGKKVAVKTKHLKQGAPTVRPAKDPVLLRPVAGGFAVIAAWNSEADDIYELGESLRLI